MVRGWPARNIVQSTRARTCRYPHRDALRSSRQGWSATNRAKNAPQGKPAGLRQVVRPNQPGPGVYRTLRSIPRPGRASWHNGAPHSGRPGDQAHQTADRPKCPGQAKCARPRPEPQPAGATRRRHGPTVICRQAAPLPCLRQTGAPAHRR